MSASRILRTIGCALVLTAIEARAEPRLPLPRPAPPAAARTTPTTPTPPAPAIPAPNKATTAPAPDLVTSVTLADIGLSNGIRFTNLGGRRDVFLPIPQGSGVTAHTLVLMLDDTSAYEARRSLEVLVDDNNAVAIALDGRSRSRSVRVPLPQVQAKDGYLKLTFQYSGAATPDRCIDVRYVGDSLVIRPETAVELDVSKARDLVTVATLTPREVALLLSRRLPTAVDLESALTIARSLMASGRRVTFHHGLDALPTLAGRSEAGRWNQGLIIVGPLVDVAEMVDPPATTVAGPVTGFGMLAAVRIDGRPAMLVSESGGAHAAKLLSSTALTATRGMATAVVRDAALAQLAGGRVTFDALGIVPAATEVLRRTDLTVGINTLRLPARKRPARLLLDVMVAPDGSGEKAVVSAYVNERLLASTVAATGEATHLDIALPDGLIGTNVNVRVAVQRRNGQGDCRFEPQGYPAQILGSSALVLVNDDHDSFDFSDLAGRWAAGVEVWLPDVALQRPEAVLGLVAAILSRLSPDSAPISVKVGHDTVTPRTAFLAVNDAPPADTPVPVHLEHGRVTVVDSTNRTLLDISNFTDGAIANVLTVGGHAGLWIKSLSASGELPAPLEFRLDRGDVAFIDRTGVALALSTRRDTLVKIAYPDRVSWLTIAERFRLWIVGGVWLIATLALLLILQRMWRRRTATAGD